MAALLAAACAAAGAWHALRGEGRAPRGDLALAEVRARQRPRDLQAQLELGAALQSAGRSGDAVRTFARAARLAPRDPRPYAWLGLLAMQDHRPDVATVNFREVTRLAPGDEAAWRGLAEASTQARVYQEAISAWEQVVRLRPDDAAAWKRLGILATRTNMVSRGHEALLRALSLNPRDAEAQDELGDCALYLGILPEARQAFEAAVAVNAGDPHALAALAQITLQQDSSPEGLARAGEQVDRSLALRPSAGAYLTRGQIDLRRKAYPAAIANFTAAQAADPHNAAALSFLSQAYAAAGQPALARKAGADYQALVARGAAAPRPGGRQRGGR